MKTFYSNCFFEALKAKLKDWKNVEVIYLPKELAFRSRFGHFLWKNKTTNDYFHFTRNGLPGDLYCNFCFKGFIEKSSKKDIEKQANSEIKRRAHSLENKYGLKLEIMEKERINSFDSWTSWNLMSDGDGLPSIESFYANGGSSVMEPIILATCYKDFGSPYQKLLVFNKSTGELKTKLLPNEKIAMTLEEMAICRPNKTGLPMNIWIDETSAYLNGGHAKGIKFQINKNPLFQTSNTCPMLLDGTIPEKVFDVIKNNKEYKLTKNDIEMVSNFVKNNSYALSLIADQKVWIDDFWGFCIKGGEIASEEEIELLKQNCNAAVH